MKNLFKKLAATLAIFALAPSATLPTTFAVTPDPLKIIDVTVDNSVFDPWNYEEAEITFITNRDAYVSLQIYDQNNDEVITLSDNEWYRAGSYTTNWDGRNRYHEIASAGLYTYKITARYEGETDTYRGNIRLAKDNNGRYATEAPQIRNYYATKDEFDPALEDLYFIFDLTAKADIEVNIYDKSGNTIKKLYDEKNREAGIYKIRWDGYEVQNRDQKYSYEIFAENAEGNYSVTGNIVVANDHKDGNKPNIFKDQLNIDNLPLDPSNKNFQLEFKLDKTADVSLEIRNGDYTVAEVVSNKSMPAGTNRIAWDGRDKYGDYLSAGVYRYKLIAANNSGKDVEWGYFSVIEYQDNFYNNGRCGGFVDVQYGDKYCDAINWAQANGIFTGYPDNSFRPNQAINRVEALKVILEAMEINSIPSDIGHMSFKDVGNEWYTSYIKTALSLGIINGYPDQTFRAENTVNRVEALKMMLETAKAKSNLLIPNRQYGRAYYDTEENAWYSKYVWMAQENKLTNNDLYFFPSEEMSRGDMADMLYRFYQANLDR